MEVKKERQCWQGKALMGGRGRGLLSFWLLSTSPCPQIPGAVSEETGVAVGHEDNSSELAGN